jgi:acyl-CoA reductase-like NAD-dependent aldehyde dehydrogenase
VKRLEVTNPFNGEKVGEVDLATEAEIERALETAHNAHLRYRHGLPASDRIAILKKVAQSMATRFEELAQMIAAEGGKPLIDARTEVARAIDGVESCATELGHLTGQEIAMGLTPPSSNRLAFTIREPIGLVVAVSAFNHPLNLIVHQVAPAVAVGCPVIVKPADDTPLSCLTFLEMLHQAGLPTEWAQCVVCDVTLAEKLVTDTRVAFFSFIGSARVGWMLRSKLAPGVRCSLEHGGAAPVIAGATADLASMIPKILKGGYYHSGQVCVSVQRVFFSDGRGRNFSEQLAAWADKLVVGNAVNESTECGPLIRHREVQRVSTWVQEAISGGALCLSGGRVLSDSTYAPTVLYNPKADSQVSKEEIFGPVVCVYDCGSTDEAIFRANSLPVAFQAAVFSNDLSETLHISKSLDASAVMVNDHTAFRVDWMPFAGRRQSGYGVGGISYTMHDMTQNKMIVLPYGEQ